MKITIGIVLFFSAALVLSAEGTRTWQQTTFEEFEKGTTHGVAVRSDGSLELAPSFRAVFTSPSTYLWSIVSDAQDNVFAASGSPARVYRIQPNGQATVVFAPRELQVQALALAEDGTLYAATSPDGRIYRITRKGSPAEKADVRTSSETVNTAQNAAANEPGGREAPAAVPLDTNYTATVFYEPKTRYIWDLALDNEGRLYVATGDNGEIFRVERNGTATVFFKSDEAHIRTLAFDNRQNLIAGSDGSGLIYRIARDGQGFVLYSAPKKEITAIAIDQRGNIFAAGVGEKRAAAVPLPQQAAPVQAPQAPGAPTASPLLLAPYPVLVNTGGSEVYRIAPDGSPRRIWSSREDIVYALGFDSSGRLVAGTGNRGRVYSIAADGTFADLLSASASQVTAFSEANDGGLHLATSNLGKVFDMGPTAGTEGTFESDVFDARIFSQWGRAQVRGTGTFELFARTGNVDNPDRNWSPWRPVDLQREQPIDAPPARFIQWRAVLREGQVGPSLDSVVINYLPKNVAPEISSVYVQPGARFVTMPRGPESTAVTVGPAPQGQARIDLGTPPATRDRTSVAVRWDSTDDNDDQLTYSLWYRGDGESRWKLLRQDLREKNYSFDAGLLPDGGYTLRVMASDAPSHTPADALSAQKESQRFEVDNTPPAVVNLVAVQDGENIHVTFRAVDDYSVIAKAEFSVDASSWQTVEPVGQLSDSRTENYDFNASSDGAPAEAGAAGTEEERGSEPAASRRRQPRGATPVQEEEHVVVVRVHDRIDNIGTAKTIVRRAPARR